MTDHYTCMHRSTGCPLCSMDAGTTGVDESDPPPGWVECGDDGLRQKLADLGRELTAWRDWAHDLTGSSQPDQRLRDAISHAFREDAEATAKYNDLADELSVAKAFHKLAVDERNLARHIEDKLRRQLAEEKRKIETVREAIDP